MSTARPLPAVTYERASGAARAPLPSAYRRREPEKSVLYGIVRENLETFLEQASLPDGDGYPRFVEREFRHYLDCGLLCNGFARLRCAQCGYERLVAFSCKGKLCPSCLNRRAADTAARLVEHLLPEAGYRQWVLTFPWTLRFRLAADRRLLSMLLGVFLRTLFAWQRRRGRALGIVGGQTGAVTFVQRFGGALNLNPHLHSIVPDGLFIPDPSGAGESGERLRFEPLPPPTTAEVEELTATIARRLMERVAAASEADGSSYLDPALAALCEALFFSRSPPAGKREMATLPGMEGATPQGKPLCASIEGFSLHAAQSVAAGDREALERLLRYGLRAPFSQERLSLSPDGKVVYRLRRPWPHAQGATHLFLEPHDFLRRLATLVSFPYSHQVRYHGVFAGRSRLRSLLPPPPPRQGEADTEALPDAERDVDDDAGESAEPAPSPTHRRRVPWARLLRRVLHVDALSCPRCSRPGQSVAMVVLAFLTDPEVVGKILRHLGLPRSAPALAPASPAHSPQLLLQQEAAFSDPALGDVLADEGAVLDREGGEEGTSSSTPSPEIRPPP